MDQPNHNTEDLTIYQMVLNRLPFLVDNSSNQKLISNFTLEIMNELEPCFRVRFTETGAEVFSRIGDEQYYTVTQKSIIADILCMYILTLKALETSGGTDGQTTQPTFMSKVKAGTVEVEYDQFKLKDSTLLAMDTETLMGTFKKNAVRKAGSLGCVIDICDDCSVNLIDTIVNSAKIQPFIVSGWGGNGGCGCGC